ncbi:hypothetical protein HK098_006780 [Nowakowskiella sp. JEL0407]|nr:hypothetical protein HK098_006780 [Nowakowskiella sp. JEL0407]
MSSFVSLVVLAAVGWLAFKSRPDSASFRQYLLSPSNPTPRRSNWLSSTISSLFSANTLPDYKVFDYVLFSIAIVDDGSQYIGIFNSWFPLPPAASANTAANSYIPVSRINLPDTVRVDNELPGDKETELAAKLRLERNYSGAANAYLRAARAYEQSSDLVQLHQAAATYEEASKAFTQANQPHESRLAMQKAIAIFKNNPQTLSRAGRSLDALAKKIRYENTGDREKNLRDALAFYRESENLFRQCDDKRYKNALVQVAEVCAELGLYNDAIVAFEEAIRELTQDEAGMMFIIKNHIVSVLMCDIGVNDWIRVRKDFDRYVDNFPGIFSLTSGAAEPNFFKNLIEAYEKSDAETFKALYQSPRNAHIFQPWQFNILNAVVIDGNDIRIPVTYVTPEGERIRVNAKEGDNLLELAHKHDIELEGACECSLACSTCHLIVDQKYYDMLEEPSDEENDMLDLAFGLTETSRLGCQIIMSPDLAGITVQIPSATRNVQAEKLQQK